MDSEMEAFQKELGSLNQVGGAVPGYFDHVVYVVRIGM